MIEMIFLMSVFAEIFTTTGGGPGNESTNLAFLIFKQALMNFDVGVASAGALFAVRARQHRRGVPDPHDRQEPRLRVDAHEAPRPARAHRGRVARHAADRLPADLAGADRVQDRAAGDRGAAAALLHADARELSPRCNLRSDYLHARRQLGRHELRLDAARPGDRRAGGVLDGVLPHASARATS